MAPARHRPAFGAGGCPERQKARTAARLWCRIVATLLVAAGPLGMLTYGVRPVMERASSNPTVNLVMRVLAAIGIAVLAFTEKLLNPGLA